MTLLVSLRSSAVGELPPRLVLFNGPPRSGKDTASKILSELLGGPPVYWLADHLCTMVQRAHWLDPHPKAYEGVKDVPMPALEGKTPRQARIAFAERYIKPTYGADFFAKRLHESMPSTVKLKIIADLGFDEEMRLLEQHHRCVIVQLRREGCDFSNDSRKYVEPGECGGACVMLDNNGSIEDLWDALRSVVAPLLTLT